MPRDSSSRRLLVKQVQALVKEPEWTLDSELIARTPDYLYTSAVYINSDGRLLEVFRDGTGSLYEYASREDWLSSLESLEVLRHQKPVHFLDGRLPQGQDFVSEVPTLINELAVKLRIPVEELDKSESSLEKVDQAVRRKGRRKCLAAGVFAPLAA